MASSADIDRLIGRVVAGIVGGALCAVAWGGLVARLSNGASAGVGDTLGGMVALLVWIGIMIVAFVATSAWAAWRLLLLASLLPTISLMFLRGGFFL